MPPRSGNVLQRLDCQAESLRASVRCCAMHGHFSQCSHLEQGGEICSRTRPARRDGLNLVGRPRATRVHPPAFELPHLQTIKGLVVTGGTGDVGVVQAEPEGEQNGLQLKRSGGAASRSRALSPSGRKLEHVQRIAILDH